MTTPLLDHDTIVLDESILEDEVACETRMGSPGPNERQCDEPAQWVANITCKNGHTRSRNICDLHAEVLRKAGLFCHICPPYTNPVKVITSRRF